MKKLTVFLCVMTLVFGAVHQILAGALFKGLGSLGSSGEYLSEVGGISSDGKVVVGHSRDDSDQLRAFRWTESTGMVSIAEPPSQAEAASSDGSVIVVTSGDQSFRWIEGYGLEPLGSPPWGTSSTSGRDVSGDGSIVVGRGGSNLGSEGWVWEEGQGFTNLGRGVAEGVSDDGTYVTGVTVDDAAGGEAFIWSEVDGMTTLGFLPDGGWSSYGNDISADGSTVVGTGWIPGGYEAFRWTEETGVEGLGDLPGGFHSSIPNAVSGDGSIVVGESSSGTPNGAFIWELGTGMRSLAEVLQNDFGLNLNGWVLWSAKGISSDGKTIVGSGKNPIGQTEAWIAYLDTKQTTQCSDFAGNWSGSWSETNCDGLNYSGTWTAQVNNDCSVIGTSSTWITVTGTIDPSTGIFTGTGTSDDCGSITLDGDFIEDSVTGSYSYSSGGGGSFQGSFQTTFDGGDGGGGGGGGSL